MLRDTFLCVPWLILTSQNSFSCVQWPISIWHVSLLVCTVTHSDSKVARLKFYVERDSFVCDVTLSGSIVIWGWHRDIKSCVSHIWTRHVTYEWVMSYTNETCHIWMGHVTRMNEACHIRMSHVTHIDESCHTYERGASQIWILVMSHIWMRHGTYMNESCHVRMSHVTHVIESCHTYEWGMSHAWDSSVPEAAL